MVQGVVIEDGCLINTNPATGEVISRVKCSLPDEIDVMVADANLAQKEWAAKSAEDRVQLLRDGLKAIAPTSTSADKLATLMVQEMGKPLKEAKEEMDFAGSKDEYMDILLKELQPQTFGNSLVVRDPYGVVVIMSPWNYPVDEILLLALPSLASGNTVIVKPSEVVPETGALLVRIFQSFLPAGVLQCAQGDGTVGKQLVAHPDIHMVAMTGSSATGRKILESASTQLKRVVLEMGGKDPMVVFGDADLDKAAKDAVLYSLCNSGQVCCSIERIYVAESIYDKFQELAKEHAANYKVGNGMDPDVKVGPLVSQLQRDQVKEQVEDAIAKGAKVLHQSSIPEATETSSFYPVTVLSDVDEGMQVFTKETFGPVVALAKFDDSESEAIRLANATEYGLGSCVYTTDMDKAKRVAARIGAGQVGINCYALDNMDVHCPWYVYCLGKHRRLHTRMVCELMWILLASFLRVGHKHSGFGFHSGADGFHQFSIPKTIVFG
jgi:acyl-CoA reductase-like NAD-dependent aldehyde dehydrogenase